MTSGWESNPVSNSLVGVSLPIDYAEEWEVLEDFPAEVINPLTYENPIGFS
jgi:hypothetical protein